MRYRFPRPVAVLLIVSVALIGCHSSQPESHAGYAGTESKSASTARRDLSQDEGEGGHTLKKHVGRTDDELRQRLRHERSIAAASTYTDRNAAEQAVGAAIASNQEKIQRWLERTQGHPNLVLDFNGSHSIGRTLRRRESDAKPCAHAIVVLKWDGNGQYHVLTSYPEC
jgi:hypothetical protein